MAITPNWRSSGNVSEMIMTAEGYIGPKNIPMKENAMAFRVRLGISHMDNWRARHIQVLSVSAGMRLRLDKMRWVDLLDLDRETVA
jgi:hypothetical protein